MPRRPLLACLALAALALGAGAAPPAPSPEFRADVLRMLRVTGPAALSQQMADAIAVQMLQEMQRGNPEVNPRIFEVMRAVIADVYAQETPALLEQLVPVYAQHFSHDEVRALVAFYESPIGRKTVSVMPAVMNGSMEVSQRWAQGLGAKVEPALLARLKQEQLIPPDSQRVLPAR